VNFPSHLELSMRPSKARYITACQQVLALGAVLAVLAPAAGVISLDVVTRHPGAGGLSGEDGWAGAAITPDAAPALVATHPVDAQVQEIALTVRTAHAAGLSGRALAGAVTSAVRLTRPAPGKAQLLTAPESVDGFRTVGVTWEHGEDVPEDAISVAVRWRKADKFGGAWSDWTTMPYHDDHGPDVTSDEALRARPGTDPVIVGDVDQVQVRTITTDGVVPSDLKLAVISPGSTQTALETPAIDTGALDAARAAGTERGIPGQGTSYPAPATDPAVALAADESGLRLTAGTVTPKPHIFSRAQWGADERLRDASSLHYYEVHAGFVHHTVNANDYTKDEVPGIIRSIYAYHTQSKGWSDIGYNFLADRFGRIWEGRYGGVDRPVVGAHTLGYNDYAFAMSAIGNYEITQPSAAMLDAYARLFAWKLSLHGVDAASTRQWVGSRYFQAINGHRDAGQTACPGKYLYAKLPTIRAKAAAYEADWTGRQRTAQVAATPYADLVVRRASDKAAFVVPTQGLLRMSAPRISQATGWADKDVIVASPDLTGDRKVDVVARDTATGTTKVYPGDGTGHFGAGIAATTAFKGLDLVTAVGDLNRDGRNDLAARSPSTGRLYVFLGNGAGGFRKVLLSASFGGYDRLVGAADLTGDRVRDLVARSTDGKLWLFTGTGAARLGAPKQLAGNWSGYDVITGYGDYTHDGRADLFARDAKTGLGYVFPNLGGGTFGHWFGPLSTAGISLLSGGGDVTGGGWPDLVGRKGGALVVLVHSQTVSVSTPIPANLTMPDVTQLLAVGDWDGNGTGDLVTKTTTGSLQLRLGNGAGSFAAPVEIGTGFDRVGLLTAVGDVTGDGYPDLMGQPIGGAMRIYAGRGGTNRLGAGYVAHAAIQAYRQIGVGLWDADGAPDNLLKVNGKLVLYPGNGPGGLVGNGTTLSGDFTAYDWMIGVGNIVGSSQPDLVVREKATGYLWVLPGGTTGFGTPQFLAEGFGGYDLAD
jgi:hypothetical protein